MFICMCDAIAPRADPWGVKMLKNERHDTIVEMCRARGTVTVREIADILGVSDMTVRRDLMELSEEGRIVRFRGGAKTTDATMGRSLICEPSHLERQLLHIDEKSHIAEIAATQVREGDTIFLGSSTTVELAAQCLPTVPLRIVTNSLPIFNLFADGDIREVILIGGTFRHHSGTFMGPLAEGALESLGFDKAFIGVNGIQDGSLYTSYFDAGRLYQIALERADERFVLADWSKMDMRGFYSFHDLGPDDTVVTDPGVSDEYLEQLRSCCNVLL